MITQEADECATEMLRVGILGIRRIVDLMPLVQNLTATGLSRFQRITRKCIAMLGLACSMLATRGWADVPHRARPNIVLILADDLGWKDLACYDSSFHETPNIDRLAGEGVSFTNAYAACPVCSPTRASLLTGKYPARLGLTHIIQACPASNRKLITPPTMDHLPLNEVTIAEALKPAGYTCASIGKWHLGGINGHTKEGDPRSQGFDANIAGNDMGQPPDYFYGSSPRSVGRPRQHVVELGPAPR